MLNRYNRITYECNGSDCMQDECVVTTVMNEAVAVAMSDVVGRR